MDPLEVRAVAQGPLLALLRPRQEAREPSWAAPWTAAKPRRRYLPRWLGAPSAQRSDRSAGAPVNGAATSPRSRFDSGSGAHFHVTQALGAASTIFERVANAWDELALPARRDSVPAPDPTVQRGLRPPNTRHAPFHNYEANFRRKTPAVNALESVGHSPT
jgi:hypothetical protein